MPYYIKSKGLVSNPNNRTVGTVPTKDMTINSSSISYNGYSFPANSSYFTDWGNDCFDSFGFFTLERISDGSKVPIPFTNKNTSDGVLYSEDFTAFGNTYTVTYGYPVQGIFKVQIELKSGTVIDVRLVIGGNFGSDGNEGYNDYTATYTGNLSSTNYTIKYFRHYDTSGYDPAVYFYFIPYDDDIFNSETYTRSYSSDNAYFYRKFKKGINFYMSKGNDTISWVIDDLQEISTTQNYTQNVADTVTITEVFARLINLLQSETSTLSDSILAKILYYGFGIDKWGINKWGNTTRSLLQTDSISISDSVIREIGILKTESITLLESIVNDLRKLLNEDIILSEGVSLQPIITFAETINLVDVLLKYINTVNADNVSILEDIIKSTAPQNFVDNININDDVLKSFITSFTETLALLDDLTKQIALLKEETYILADDLSNKYINTTLTDTLNVLEQVSRLIIQGNQDEAVNILDNFLKSIIKPDIMDSFTQVDNISLNTQTNQADTLGFAENFVANMTKNISDILTISDSLASKVDALKGEMFGIDESLSSSFIKIMSDIVNLNDELIKSEVVGLPKRVFNFGLFNYTSFGGNEVDTDITSVSDEISIIQSYSSLISDIINLSEILRNSISSNGSNETQSIVDTIGLFVGKGFNEDLTVNDILLNVFIDKKLNEVLNLFDAVVNNITTIQNEVLNINEGFINGVYKNTSEIVNLVENFNSQVNSVINDIINTLEVVSNFVGRDKFNDVITSLDSISSFVNILFTDELNSLNDNLNILLNKFSNDVLAVSDNLFNFFMEKILSDNLTISESVIDFINKNINDDITIGEILNNLLVKVLNDNTVLGEDFILNIGKSLSNEGVTFNDSVLSLVSNIVSDNFTVSENINYLLNKYISENLTISDVIKDYIIMKFINEDITIADILQKFADIKLVFSKFNNAVFGISKFGDDVREPISINDYIDLALYIRNSLSDVLNNISDLIEKNINPTNNESLNLLDTIGLNIGKLIQDGVTISDFTFLNISTILQDTVVLLDNLIKDVSILQLSSNSVITDSLKFDIITQISELVSILDSIAGYGTLIQDTINVSDLVEIFGDKKLSDSLSFSDVLIKTLNLTQTETVSISDLINSYISVLQNDIIDMNFKLGEFGISLPSDILYINTQKELQSVFNTAIWNYSMFGNKSTDNTIINDALTLIMNFKSNFNELLTIIDSIVKNSNSLNNENVTNVLDSLGLNIGKSLVDSATLVEGINFDIIKILNDLPNILDDIIKEFSKVLTNEVLTINESISKSIILSTLNEFNSILDGINAVLGKVVTSTLSLNDSIRFDILTSKQEVLNILEALGFDITKPLPSDLVGVLDEAWIKAIANKQSYIMVGDELVEIEKKVVIMNQVFINGVQVPVVNLTIKDTTTERVSTCEFIIPDPSPEIIALCRQRAEVRVYLIDEYGNVHYFGGRIKGNPIETDSPVTSLLKVTAFDYTDYANDVRVVETYTLGKDGTLTDILKKMWQKYSPFNIDLSGVVDTDKTIQSITFKYETLFNATEKIAQLLGYHWFVEWNGANSKILRFFPGNNTIKNVTLSRENFNIVAGTVNFAQQDALYNRIYLFGGKTFSNDYIFTTIANGNDTIYSLPHKPYPPLGKEMVVVKVNGVSKKVDFDYPYWIDGVDVMLNVEGKYIRFNQNTKPANGSIIEVIYRYEYPVALVLEDAESIRKYGLSEYVVTDEKINNYTNGIDYVKQLLEQYAYPKWYGTLETTESSLRAGDIVRVYLPHLLIDDIFEIIEVEKTSERNMIRTKLTLNKTENPDEVIAKRLKEFAKRLQDLEMKDLQENTIIQKVNSVKERLKMKDTLSIYGNIYYNIGENILSSDGNISIKHTSGSINKYYEWKQEITNITESTVKNIDNKSNKETPQFSERVFIGITDDINNVFSIAKFGEKKFVKGLWL